MKGQATKRENVFIAWLTNKSLDPVYYKEFLQIDKKKMDGIEKHARVLNWHLTKEGMHIPNKHKRFSISLVVRKMKF